MSFPTHTIESAPIDSRPAMNQAAAKFGAVPAAVSRLATSPHLLNGFLTASAGFEQTSLSPIEREVVIMTVAVRNGCQVCIRIHGAALTALDRTDLVAPLAEGCPLGDETLESVRTLTDRLIDRSGAVDDAELDAFLATGHTRQQALEVVLGIGAYTMSTIANRLVRA